MPAKGEKEKKERAPKDEEIRKAKISEMFQEFMEEKYNTSGSDALYSLDEAIEVIEFYMSTVADDQKRASAQSVMAGLKALVEQVENESPIVCPKCGGQTFTLRRMGERGTLMECQTCKEQNWEENLKRA